MKRFTFKLENVLRYRHTVEGLAKNAYQEALQYLNIEKEKLANLETNREKLMKQFNYEAGTVVQPEMLTFLAKYSMQLAHIIELQKKVVDKKNEAAQEKFREWNRKRMDVKVMERLKEKKWNEYRLEADKEDQKFQDEIFIAKKIRETRTLEDLEGETR
jgi:flagellar protein FliJ